MSVTSSTHSTEYPLSPHNASQAELDKFAQLADKWWDKTGPFKPLHQLNPLRLSYVQDTVGTLTGKRLVDIGCGGGIFSESLAQQGADVLGIDLAEPVIAVAQHHKNEYEPDLPLEYRLQSSTDLAHIEPAAFDVVTCMEMLEHVPDPTQTVQECADLAKPGGWVFFATINRTTWSYLFAILGAEYVLKLLPRGTHDYSQFIRPSELAHWARCANLDLQSIQGMTYSPWNGEFHWSSNPSVNYLMAFRKPA